MYEYISVGQWEEQVDRLRDWAKEAEAAMEKAIATGDVTELKEVVNHLRDLGFGKDDNG